MVTINDIAKLSGVAKSTVSRYLNGGSVSAKTSKIIEQVILETDYKPNVFAQSLKAKKTGLVGVIIPRLGSAATNTILKSLDGAARLRQQQMIIVDTEQSLEREIEAIQTLAKQKVDSIILIATLLNEQHYALIDTIDTPIIILGQSSQVIPAISYDDYNAGQQIGEYVKKLGHQHVLYIGVPEYDYAVGYLRKKGVLDTLQVDDNITVDTIETSFHLADAYQLGLAILPQLKASYIVAATDNIALGILRAAYELGMKVPEDFSLSGFGGYESTLSVHPPITSVVFPYAQAGEKALDVIERMTIKANRENNIVLPVQLVERKSTRQAK